MINKHSKPKLSRSILKNMLLATVLSTGLLGTLWIHSEYKTFRTESGAIREKFLTSYKELLKTEVNKASSYIEYQKERVEPRLKESIQERVNEAHAIALNIFNQYRGKRTFVEMQEMVKEALRSIRFNKGRGYYFAFNLRGIEELYADKPEMEGKDMLSVQGAKGEYVVKDMLDIVRRDKEGFYKYTWMKPNKEGHFPKIAYVKLFEPFGWVIGTGEYLDDVESDIQKEVIGFIEQIRYKEDGYIFVGQWDGVSLTIPAKGQNMWNVTDSNGKKIVQELIRLAKEGSGYFEYVMPKLQDKRPAPKLSYVVGVPEWKWYVGTGIYVDEIETTIEQRKKEFEQQIINHLVKIALVLAGLVLLVLFVALVVFRKAKKNLDSFSTFFERATVELNEINPDIMDFIELQDLANSANEMVKARKQAEKALRESEDRFVAIFNTQLNGIVIIDPETHTIVDANTAALDMIGATRADVIGHICHKFICSTERGMCPITDLGIDVDNSERVLIRTDRSELPVLKSVSQLKLGNTNFLIESFIDITERKQVEESLRESEEKFRSIVETTVEWIWEMDLNGRHTFSNRSITDILGYRPEEFVGHIAGFFLHAEDRAEVEATLPQLIAKKRGWRGWILRWRHKDGSYRFLESNAEPILDSNGEVLGYRGTDRDITERKQADEERERLQNQLLQAQKMEALGHLAGGVAHDLNNVLGILSGYSELLLLEIPEESRAREHAKKILQSTEKGAAIIQDLLTLARRSVVVSEVINLNNILSGFLKAPVFEKMKDHHPRVTFRTECDKNLLNIKGSPVHLEKTLMNLVSNAAESISGKGEVTIRTESRYLDKSIQGMTRSRREIMPS